VLLILLQAFFEYFETVSLYELIGTISGIVAVWLAIRENIWTWPVRLISVVMAVIIFMEARLYTDMALNLLLAIAIIFGWHNWLHGEDEQEELRVKRVGTKEFGLLLGVGLVFSFGFGYLLDTFTRVDWPYVDATTTAISLVGYWMLAKKQIESWVIWVLLYTAYMSAYYYSGLYLFSGIFFLYLILAAYGYLLWRKALLQRLKA
jgi:nicotinamide mononucleotide transporter